MGGRFVKLYHRGDEISPEKFDSFIIKKIQFLFINSEDMNDYRSWSSSLKAQPMKSSEEFGDAGKQVANISSDVRDEFLQFVTSAPEDREIRSILDQTKKLAQAILTRRSVADLLGKMQSLGETFVDHGTNVANLSLYIGASLGYTHQVILENLYLGGLFHDYGKVKIDASLQDNQDSDEYKQALLNHPTIGRAALLSETRLGDEVLDIVAQHHEKHDGSGHPMGLKGSRIYELTKIVSIANIFDHQVIAAAGSIHDRQISALKYLEADEGKECDPKIVAKVLRCMRLVI